MKRTCVVVFGGSRGIGAAIVERLATAENEVIFTFHRRHERAAEVCRRARYAQACKLDICSEPETSAFFAWLSQEVDHVTAFVLSASGGLEPGRGPQYAHEINVVAQERLLRYTLPLIRATTRIIFLTSHEAHFYGRKAPYPAYEKIAATKREGEDAVLAQAVAVASRGGVINVVSADIVEGTATAKLLAFKDGQVLEKRREAVGILPTPADVARQVVELITHPAPNGAVKYVWEPDAYYLDDPA
jgi:3-oxoacyl-[acyl-carrier protein] reductase